MFCAGVDARPPRNVYFRGGRVHTSLKNVQRRQAPSPPATVSQQLDKQAQTYYKRLMQHANLPPYSCRLLPVVSCVALAYRDFS